ncbi:MAG: twin transmembrane helix small protein [Pseudomonadota bacterium]
MSTFVYIAVSVITVAVLIVLIIGLGTLLKGGKNSLSQRLMRWRIGLQLVAIVLVMGFVFLTQP